MKNRIKDLRKAKGLTQEELSQLVGVSRQSIVAIETGKYNPSLILAFNIARQFNCSIEDVFLFDQGDEYNE